MKFLTGFGRLMLWIIKFLFAFFFFLAFAAVIVFILTIFFPSNVLTAVELFQNLITGG